MLTHQHTFALPLKSVGIFYNYGVGRMCRNVDTSVITIFYVIMSHCKMSYFFNEQIIDISNQYCELWILTAGLDVIYNYASAERNYITWTLGGYVAFSQIFHKMLLILTS